MSKLDFSKENLVRLQQERNLEGDEFPPGPSPLPPGPKVKWPFSEAKNQSSDARGEDE